MSVWFLSVVIAYEALTSSCRLRILLTLSANSSQIVFKRGKYLDSCWARGFSSFAFVSSHSEPSLNSPSNSHVTLIFNEYIIKESGDKMDHFSNPIFKRKVILNRGSCSILPHTPCRPMFFLLVFFRSLTWRMAQAIGTFDGEDDSVGARRTRS